MCGPGRGGSCNGKYILCSLFQRILVVINKVNLILVAYIETYEIYSMCINYRHSIKMFLAELVKKRRAGSVFLLIRISRLILDSCLPNLDKCS